MTATVKQSRTVMAMVLVFALSVVWAALIVLARVTVAAMRPDPWSVPGFADDFAAWVEWSTAPRQATAPALGELELVVAALTRPVAPRRLSLRAA